MGEPIPAMTRYAVIQYEENKPKRMGKMFPSANAALKVELEKGYNANEIEVGLLELFWIEVAPGDWKFIECKQIMKGKLVDLIADLDKEAS